jgi:hypothetical protein
MKGFVQAIRKSKYGNLIRGTLFACLAIPFMVWGFSVIFSKKGTCSELIIPFLGTFACLLSGLYSMFHKKKIKNPGLNLF